MTDIAHSEPTSSQPPLLLVTGASGGIGSAVRRLAAARAWRLASVSRRGVDPVTPEECVIAGDVSTETGAAAALDAVRAHFGEAPSRLCHAAGNVRLGAIERAPESQWREVLAANLDSTWYTLQAWSRLRGADAGGAAVVFSSVAARMGTPNHAAVAAAKAGVEGLVRALAADWAARGRRINALALGLTETPMTEAFTRGERARQGVTVQYPLGRLGRAEEAADWALRLLDEDSWVTGQIIALDGGFTAVRPLVRAG